MSTRRTSKEEEDYHNNEEEDYVAASATAAATATAAAATAPRRAPLRRAAPTAATAPNEESIGLNLVRACSEALTIAVAKTLTTEDIAEIFVYREEIKQASYSDQEAPSKFLVQLLTGGKAAGSAVKFSKFYLVVDTAIVEPD